MGSKNSLGKCERIVINNNIFRCAGTLPRTLATVVELLHVLIKELSSGCVLPVPILCDLMR